MNKTIGDNMAFKKHRGMAGQAWLGAALAGALCGVLATTPALAIDIDAGDYAALPAGTNLGLVYYQYAQRNALYSRDKRVPVDAGLDSQVGILRGVHYLRIGGYTVDPQFLLPFGQLKASNGTSALGEASGVGDLILAATVWLVNQPEANTYFGITPFLTLPSGQFDRNKALNLGEKRSKLTLQAGYITGLSPSLTLDLAADVTLYGRNNDFGPGGQTLKQDPSYQAQLHLRYHVNPALDLRAGISKTVTGESTVNGLERDDRGSTTKLYVGAAYFLRPSTQLLASLGRDVSVREGFEENRRLNLRLLQVF